MTDAILKTSSMYSAVSKQINSDETDRDVTVHTALQLVLHNRNCDYSTSLTTYNSCTSMHSCMFPSIQYYVSILILIIQQDQNHHLS